MEEQAKQYHTPEEYLALEETAEFKSEYYRGEIFAMAGGSVDHNQIISNLNARLNLAFRNKNCRVYAADVRLRVEARDMFTYPELLVVCGQPEFYRDRNDTVTNPLVIIEVLSESTKNYDRGEKFEIYRTLPTLKEYILVDQYKAHLEHFSRTGKGQWLLEEFDHPDAILHLPEIDFQISLREIYDKIEW